MTQLALARKWRPRRFADLVGQEHVVRALTYALTTGRLHHAYLFTGTRGVGKTTISRIFAKALNCETGVTATPCNRCQICQEIDADRFPDYVEMDAASNRGVDEMIALLEQAAYAPVAGRFKVYMIDEVHMLTGHAFNAMLKTLEEPPAHIKFVLATTDPQKIPVTILSRCLQFGLRALTPEAIATRCREILTAEAIPFQTSALPLIGQAARGSMRDALSLLEQAIAYSAGTVTEEQVRSMLGLVSEAVLFDLLLALADGDLARYWAAVTALTSGTIAGEAVLAMLAQQLHLIARSQFGAPADDELPLMELAQRWDPEFVQLAYAIVVQGRRDLPLAPDEATGLEMTLLRLLAFAPQKEPDPSPLPPGPAPKPLVALVSSPAAASSPAIASSLASSSPTAQAKQNDAHGVPTTFPARGVSAHNFPPAPVNAEESSQANQKTSRGPAAYQGDRQAAEQRATQPGASAAGGSPSTNETEQEMVPLPTAWLKTVAQLPLTGMLRTFADHCALVADDGTTWTIGVDRPAQHWLSSAPELGEKLKDAFAAVVAEAARRRWHFVPATDAVLTLARQRAAAEEAERKALLAAAEHHPGVRFLTERLELEITLPSSSDQFT